MKFALQIGPEFFKDVGRHIDSDLNAKLCCGVVRGTVVGIVGVGNGDGGRVSRDLGVIESGAARIGVGPEDLAGSVPEPGPSAPSAFTEVTRVLVKKDGEKAFGQVVADDKVAIGGAEVSAESGGALAERAIRGRRLCFGSEDARQNDRPTVEGIFGSDFEFLAGRERVVILEARRASVIGDNAQKAFAFWLTIYRRRNIRRAEFPVTMMTARAR